MRQDLTNTSPRRQSCPASPRPLAVDAVAADGGGGSAADCGDTDRWISEPIPSQRKSLRSRSASRSAPSHFSPRVSQGLTQTLLSNSDQHAMQDILVFETAVTDDWNEASLGWRGVVPYPKYVSQVKNQRLTKSPKKGLLARNSHPDVPCLMEMGEGSGGRGVLCPWKATVDPGTYQYVPNNGCYRNAKTGPSRLSKSVQDWLTQRTVSRSPRSVMDRQLQKASQLRGSANSEPHADPGENRTAPAVTTSPDGAHTQLPSEGRLAQNSAQRDRAQEVLQYASKCLRTQSPMAGQKVAKTVSSSAERFVTNFTTRLSTLERELNRQRRPSCPSGTSTLSTESSTSTHFPAHLANRLHVKDMYVPNTTRLAIQKKRTRKYGDDLFTVIPMCKAETPRLRPLEKVTPKQQRRNSSSSQEKGPPDGDGDGGEDPADSPSQDPASLPVPTVPETCSISVARSAIARTNLRIEQMRNSPLRSMMGSGSSTSSTSSMNKGRSFFAHKGSGLALLKNGAVRFTATKNL